MPSRAGSPNKNKRFLLTKLEEMYGKDFHPIMKMAKNCVVLQGIADKHADGMVSVEEGGTIIDAFNSAKAAIEGWDKMAQYVEPKLKAIEVGGTIELIPHEKWVEMLADE